MDLDAFLAESSRLWKLLVENTRDLIIVVDASAVIKYATPSHLDVLGYQPLELVGKSYFSLVHPDDLEAAFSEYIKGIGEKATVYTTFRIRHGDGNYIRQQSSGMPLVDNQGEVMGGIVFGRDISASIEAEEALRASEERYRALFRDSPGGVFYYDNNLILTDCNERLVDILKSSREKLIGLDLTTLRDQSVLPAIRKPLQGEDGFYEGHYRAHTSDEELWATVRTTTLYDRDGRIAGGMVMMEDITRLVEAESSLRVQRDLALRLARTDDLRESLRLSLEAILETTGFEGGGIYLTDEETGALELIYHTGLSGEFVASVAHPEADSPSTRLVMAGEPVYLKYDESNLQVDDVRGREGLKALAVVPIIYQGMVIGDVNVGSRSLDEVPEKAREVMETIAGQIGQAIVRMRLNAALQESEQRYRTVLEATGTAMCVVGSDERIRYVNQEFLRLTGFLPGEPESGLVLRGILREADTRAVMAQFEGLKAGVEEESRYLLLRLIPAAGEAREVLSSMGLLPGREAFVLSLIDVTRERQYEKELEERAWQLREFLGVAAHELRHPIALIMGYAETLGENLEEAPREAIREIAQAIETSSRRLTHLSEELLDISRIEQGSFPVEKEPVELGAVLLEAVKEMRERHVGREFEFCSEGAGPLTLLDEERIRQLMVILLENAVNFSEPEDPVETVVEWLGSRVMVSVSDRGIGVPEDKREKIFDRFFQVQDSDHHSTPGLGLGLFIAAQIVEAHDGNIWCEERPGGGSIFRFTLPVQTG